jgi:hypothetical protein
MQVLFSQHSLVLLRYLYLFCHELLMLIFSWTLGFFLLSNWIVILTLRILFARFCCWFYSSDDDDFEFRNVLLAFCFSWIALSFRVFIRLKFQLFKLRRRRRICFSSMCVLLTDEILLLVLFTNNDVLVYLFNAILLHVLSRIALFCGFKLLYIDVFFL